MARQPRMFTIFHALDAKGYFNQPANADSRNESTGENLYKGPVPFPKMFYHPLGAERVTVPAEYIETPLGVKKVNEQRELIWDIASNEEEAKKFIADGWHDSPAKAIAKREGREVGPDLESQVATLEAEKARMELELNTLRAKALANDRPTGEEVNRAKRVEN